MSQFKISKFYLTIFIAAAILNFHMDAHASAASDDGLGAPAALSSSSSASDVATHKIFYKISSLDELPTLLDRTIACDGTELTRVVFLDFDDCMAQRRHTLNILDATFQFDWISSPERIRQIKDNVAKDLGASDTWDVVSKIPTIGSMQIAYQPVGNLAAIIAALKARKFVVKVCSGLQIDNLRLTVLTQNGLSEEDYLYANRGKAAAMLKCILNMRKKSEGKKNDYLAMLVDNYFPDEEQETGSSPSELVQKLSEEIAKINGGSGGCETGSDESGSDDENEEPTLLKITSMFVHDRRFESALEAAKPQIRTEIEQSLQAHLALLNAQKTTKEQSIADVNRQFVKREKSKVKKLRHNRAKIRSIKDRELKKAKQEAIERKMSEVKSERKSYELDVAKAQKSITEFDQKIEEFTSLLTEWQQSTGTVSQLLGQ